METPMRKRHYSTQTESQKITNDQMNDQDVTEENQHILHHENVLDFLSMNLYHIINHFLIIMLVNVFDVENKGIKQVIAGLHMTLMVN